MKSLLISVIYQEFDIIKTHIESLLFLDVDIIILENYSNTTEFLLKPFCLDLLNRNKIIEYWLFDKNIGGSVFTIFFEKFMDKIYNYDYIIITDGDIKLRSDEVLNEIVKILDVEDCFACAADIDPSNLPLETIPESVNWMPKAIDHEWYLESATAGHLLTFKKENLLAYLKHQKETNEIFIDHNMRRFCSDNNKKWLKTKYNKIYHLTWDLYHDLNHPYTKMKMKPREDIFLKSHYCGYTIYGIKNEKVILERIDENTFTKSS